MELNTSGMYKVVAEMNPFRDMLREMRRRSIPVVIGSDAHEPSAWAIALARHSICSRSAATNG